VIHLGECGRCAVSVLVKLVRADGGCLGARRR
jgi:hypothetical protein